MILFSVIIHSNSSVYDNGKNAQKLLKIFRDSSNDNTFEAI